MNYSDMFWTYIPQSIRISVNYCDICGLCRCIILYEYKDINVNVFASRRIENGRHEGEIIIFCKDCIRGYRFLGQVAAGQEELF